ncbi:uncharacterized protein LOC129742081 [Uranotaenia lowii]|uniref:uncharacterized protein LOC129742081 n=1 Tax=Uranotaenia lowii TaxID=190385 RepID=UPI0024797450|nr:uncharacterized protein LOC129742081 [Uranotaenia lowii]
MAAKPVGLDTGTRDVKVRHRPGKRHRRFTEFWSPESRNRQARSTDWSLPDSSEQDNIAGTEKNVASSSTSGSTRVARWINIRNRNGLPQKSANPEKGHRRPEVLTA